ncbi:MAG TPA: hypothetical protein VJK30_01850 [Coxiellaceae bacterium]|nr:MAG: hypothetical protein A3E81_04100 [Gammaproteobacteria bacterium RIFCSPHIGHO2_12_FULL_36_30]HLB56063.1 hypothetical protein [Coxiellaceae bacterium]
MIKKIIFLTSALCILSTASFAGLPLTCPTISAMQHAHYANEAFGVYFFNINGDPTSIIGVVPSGNDTLRRAKQLLRSTSSSWTSQPVIIRDGNLSAAYCSYKPGNNFFVSSSQAPFILWSNESSQQMMEFLQH